MLCPNQYIALDCLHNEGSTLAVDEGISVESNQDHVIVVLSIWLILQMKILIKVNEISFLVENRWPP